MAASLAEGQVGSPGDFSLLQSNGQDFDLKVGDQIVKLPPMQRIL